MVEGARLESVYTLTAYQGFESLLLRHTQSHPPLGGFFYGAEKGKSRNSLEPSITLAKLV